MLFKLSLARREFPTVEVRANCIILVRGRGGEGEEVEVDCDGELGGEHEDGEVGGLGWDELDAELGVSESEEEEQLIAFGFWVGLGWVGVSCCFGGLSGFV